MACGAPVVTSNIPSITEVAGDAAELISPTDVQQLAHAIAELICDQEKRIALSRRGLKRAAEFTWERTALLTLEVYREALKKRSGRFRQ
jgi:glycosyltransferase involved in cell wall biosynthesis